MGIAVVIFMHAILFAVLLLVCFTLASAARRSLQIKSRYWLWTLRIAPFAIAALPFTFFVVSIAWANLAPASALFEAVFDQPASDDVTNLKGSSDAVNDAQHIFLAFKTSSKTLSLLTKGFRPLAADRASDKVPLPVAPVSVPPWWVAEHCQDRSVFGAESIRHWNDVVVAECRSDGRIYVEAIWIE